MKYDVNGINETYERAQAEGLKVSRHFIRQACIDGRLKCCKSGRKYLIHYDNLLELLKNGDNQPTGNEVIRKLSERLRPNDLS